MKAFLFTFDSGFAVARVGFAIDDESENPIFPTKSLVRLDFLAYPARLRRARGADHNQVARLPKSFLNVRA